ncbi:enoyl-ACP reductase FabI [Desulfovibrio inopinatus]|uniref:enoyl-ACP reductase FabI n=1 Tax=Desulfovibrio inopinatus TaxID=102109 RepID=UPI0004103FD1|nr:enoyl-ACP reductase [Desulfovibrio inopinatus]
MLLADKKAVIFGVANERSIAYGVSKKFKEHGAKLAFSYVGDALKKRVAPISEDLGGDFIFDCDVTKDEQILAAREQVKATWGQVDILVHSVAFANREDLKNRYVDTSREGFALALDISAYSLVALCQAFEPILAPNASVMTMTYLGSQRVVGRYNVMGVAKAALEASVRYLACDLGQNGVRVNALSPGPIKTLAASGVSGLKSIFTKVEESAPLARNVTTEDVGNAAVFLASDLSSGVTAETIYVDSGYNVMGV